MNLRIIKSLVIKDIVLFFRDKFFGIMTGSGLLLYIVFYMFMPDHVDEKIEIGLYSASPLPIFEKFEEEGLVIRQVPSDSILRRGIINKEFQIGIAIPEDFITSFTTSQRPRLFVYTASDLPEEFRDLYIIFIEELMQMITGEQLNIDGVDIVLGPDMGGMQIPVRDRMLPLFVFIILLMETLGLANLITSEKEGGTIEALMITPMNVVDLFIAKGITGIGLAVSQCTLFMLVVGCLTVNGILIITCVFLGAMMTTALAFFIAAIAKDMMSVVAWGSLMIGILSLPALNLLIPGPVSEWIKAIPSYYLVDVLHKAINFNSGWGENGHSLLIIVLMNVFFILLGILTLKRKIACA